MKERLSILTEDQALGQTLADGLTKAGFEVQVLPTAPRFWQRARSFMSSLLIVDLDTLGNEALAQCRHLRALSAARILALARTQSEDAIWQIFSTGVDDYMSKPVSQAELEARVEALLRRRRSTGGFRISRVPLGDRVTLDTDNRVLYVAGQRVKLTPIEYSLLDCLLRHAGQVVSRGTLLRQVWGSDKSPGVGSLNLYIYYLRRKIEHDPRHPEHILTKWGVGYYLTPGNHEIVQQMTAAAAADYRLD